MREIHFYDSTVKNKSVTSSKTKHTVVGDVNSTRVSVTERRHMQIGWNNGQRHANTAADTHQ